MILTHTFEIPLGVLVGAATDAGICLLEFDDPQRLVAQMARVVRRVKGETEPGMNAHMEQLERELGEYFARRRRSFEVALVFPGTPFQRAVWDALCQIPYGETRTYDEIARQLGHPLSARAVGTANGSNPISIIIPCHRLVNSQGGLSGYGGGLWRKQCLLELEGAKL